jgi:hypothetical protein
VSLTALRPDRPTDLVQLSDVLRRQNAKHAALPASLSEPMLLSVARDLRSVESETDEYGQASVAAPLMLVFSLLLGSDKAENSGGEAAYSEEALWKYLKIYQWAIEREIVTRITGLGGTADESKLMEQLSELSDAIPD